jgi:hypothetical protein
MQREEMLLRRLSALAKPLKVPEYVHDEGDLKL